MRVLVRHLTWVVEIIGAERAALCESLPRSARVTKPKAKTQAGEGSL
jgi:hypothetical protein